MGDVTRIFEVLPGDPTDAVELLPLLYEELRRLAAQKLAGEPHGQILQPTALVHEAWLRMTTGQPQKWQNQAHFLVVPTLNDQRGPAVCSIDSSRGLR